MTRTIWSISFSIYVEHTDCTLVSHPLFRDTDDLLVVVAERHPFYRCRELPYVQTLPRCYRPQSQSVISCTWYQESWFRYASMSRIVTWLNIENGAHSLRPPSRPIHCFHRTSPIVLRCERTKRWWYYLLSRWIADLLLRWIWSVLANAHDLKWFFSTSPRCILLDEMTLKKNWSL